MQEFTVPGTLAAAQTARVLVTRFCQQQELPADIVDNAALLVSELTGNALLHARSSARIRLSHTADTLRVEVTDDSEQLPQLRAPHMEATGGRGVLILDVLASRYGAAVRTDPPPLRAASAEDRFDSAVDRLGAQADRLDATDDRRAAEGDRHRAAGPHD